MKYSNIKFPNLTIRKRKLCNTDLSIQSKLLNGKIVNQPNMIFLFSLIRKQLANFYNYLGFENNLQYQINYSSSHNLLYDIYNSDITKYSKINYSIKIWKYFLYQKGEFSFRYNDQF